MRSQIRLLLPAIAALTLLPAALRSAGTASNADKTFVGKVSQGGMYEVEASRVAEQKAVAQDVKDVAFSEVHDHELVNRELKKISTASGVPVGVKLNAEFQARLDKLKGVSADQFDSAYMSDMADIHDKDEKLFAQEAGEGTGDFTPFASKTDLIVKRHIGAIHGAEPK